MNILGGDSDGDDTEDDDTIEFPNGTGEDYWTDADDWDSLWKSDLYDAEMHIPFTQKTVEFGFLNGDAKTITYAADTPRLANPTRSTVGDVQRRHYYQVDGAEANQPRHGSQVELQLTRKDIPELTIVPANQTYMDPIETEPVVGVVEATVYDIFLESSERLEWKLESIDSFEVVPRDEIDDLRKDYPINGAHE